MKTHFGSVQVQRIFNGQKLPHLFYALSQYDHMVIDHAIPQMKVFGNILNFSSWYLEALNKEWKYYVAYHACHGGVAAIGRSVDDQTLRRMCVRCDPEVRGAALESMGLSQRAPYMCSKCHLLKKGHFCPYKTPAYLAKQKGK